MAIQAGRLVDVADFVDSGWVDCTLASGTTTVSGHDYQVRRIGEQIYMRGRANRATSSGTQIWLTLPAGFWPDRIVEISHRTASNAPTRVYVTPDGELASQGTPTTNAALQSNDSWIRAE